jgi:hypothetical protein
MLPIILPAALVIAPIAPIVISIPMENISEVKNARFVDICPCSLINPTIKGMLARWHGLRIILNMPQTKEARIAIMGVDCMALVSVVNRYSITYLLPSPLV